MATTINRTPMVDDDGSGTTGTIINNAWKQEMYSQIDAALAAVEAGASLTVGTWTPAIQAASGSGVTYTDRYGTWLRIGTSFVLATGYVILSSKGTIAGAVQIAGWPAPFYGAGLTPVGVGYFSAMATAWSSLTGRGVPGGALADLFGVTGGGGSGCSAVQATDLSNSTMLVFQGSYRTT